MCLRHRILTTLGVAGLREREREKKGERVGVMRGKVDSIFLEGRPTHSPTRRNTTVTLSSTNNLNLAIFSSTTNKNENKKEQL